MIEIIRNNLSYFYKSSKFKTLTNTKLDTLVVLGIGGGLV